MKVVWFKKHQNLAEIYQESGLRFALAGEDEKGNILQAHPWVKCRDFLHDALRAQLTKSKASVYGFHFDYNNADFPDISTDKTLLLISQKFLAGAEKKLFRHRLSKALRMIHKYEEMEGIERKSTIKKVSSKNCKGLQNYKQVWLFEGSNYWISRPYMISLLTFLLRLGKHIPERKKLSNDGVYEYIINRNKSKETVSNDVRYTRQCAKNLTKLLKANKNMIDFHGDGEFSSMYFNGESIGTFHDNSGIVSACKRLTCNKEFNEELKKFV